jgi:uncharacterized protein DUF6573
MNDQQQTVNPWEGVEVISAYTRAQALEDGVLVDITAWAREAGFTFPIAVTSGVWEVLKPSPELEADGEDVVGRGWDMLTILRESIRGAARTDEVHFAPMFTMMPGRKVEPVEMWAKCSPGDDGEPVITVLLKGED